MGMLIVSGDLPGRCVREVPVMSRKKVLVLGGNFGG